MFSKRATLGIISALLIGAGRLNADDASCITLSSGSVTYVTGGTQLVGITCIGRASNGTVNLVAGIARCSDAGITCVLGDVDHNGLIDGDDIDDYVRVKITNTGTAYEFCASNLSTAEFVQLLLIQP